MVKLGGETAGINSSFLAPKGSRPRDKATGSERVFNLSKRWVETSSWG